MKCHIKGRRLRHQHLAPDEIEDLMRDIAAGEPIRYLCAAYFISSRVAYKYRALYKKKNPPVTAGQGAGP